MKLITTLAFVALSFGLQAQVTLETPRTEFNLALSQDKLTLKPAERKEVTVNIARSKSYSKVKARFCVMGTLPKGITVTFDPQEGKVDIGKATIEISADATEGKHLIVLGAELSGKKKGSILELNIGQDQLASQ